MMDKISYYNIEARYEDDILLYNTLTDSLVRFTDEEYDEVKTLLDNLVDFKGEYPTLYAELKKAGFIIDENFNELEYIKYQNKRRIYANSDYHITINPTLDCNLRCWYCSTELAEAKHSGVMSPELVNSVKAHLKHVIEVQKAASLHLDWFGGEPAMYFEEVIEPISAYANELTSKNNVKFTQHITTNATLLNEERIRRMKELNFTSFQIPIDGNEKRHNEIKKSSDLKSTYKLVVDNVNLIADIIPKVYIILRINYDKQTLKHIDDILKDISEESKKYIYVDFQKVWQISSIDNGLLIEAKEKFRLNGLNSEFWAYNPRKFYRCYSDKYHHYAINYDGKLFKCTAQNYGDDKVVGNLLPDGKVAWNDELLSAMFAQATFENERCLKCNKLPVCMGPCIAKNYAARKNNTPIPCLYENVQYSIEDHIIEEAKKRKLIQETV